MPSLISRIALSLFAARWLGHGRAIECYLVSVTGVYGVLLLTPGAAFDSKATVDIAWAGYGHWLALGPLSHFEVAGFGLLGNIKGWRGSRVLRFLGAMIGSLLWTWCAAKFAVLGDIATVGFPFCLVAILFSFRIMALALADLPPPGAPGAIVR